MTGVDLLEDLSVFFRALGGMIDGFVARADRVAALLGDPGTTFLIVTAPRHDPVEEAIFLHRKLREGGLPFGGVVVNRLQQAPELDGELPEAVTAELGEALAGRVATSARELAALAARDAANVAHLRERLGDPPLIVVPERQDDVHDVEGLAYVREHLWGRLEADRPLSGELEAVAVALVHAPHPAAQARAAEAAAGDRGAVVEFAAVVERGVAGADESATASPADAQALAVVELARRRLRRRLPVAAHDVAPHAVAEDVAADVAARRPEARRGCGGRSGQREHGDAAMSTRNGRSWLVARPAGGERGDAPA